MDVYSAFEKTCYAVSVVAAGVVVSQFSRAAAITPETFTENAYHTLIDHELSRQITIPAYQDVVFSEEGVASVPASLVLNISKDDVAALSATMGRDYKTSKRLTAFVGVAGVLGLAAAGFGIAHGNRPGQESGEEENNLQPEI